MKNVKLVVVLCVAVGSICALGAGVGGGGRGGESGVLALAATGGGGAEAGEQGAMWVILGGILVMGMQLGFGLVEAGLCRARNAAHTFAMNFMGLALTCLAFWAFGFAVGWGNGGQAMHAAGPMSASGLSSGWGLGLRADGTYTYGLVGIKGFFVSTSSSSSTLLLFFFTMMLCKTMAAIAPGAMAERWRFGNFCWFCLWVVLPFGLFASWTWGGGWLAEMGRNWGLGHGLVDFAGSGVVHAMGGVVALVGAMVIGPRIGKYIHGRPVAIPGHSLTMVMGGTLVLAAGWLGMTAGWVPGGADVRREVIVVNTVLAGMSGAVASMLVMWNKFGKPDPSIMCNGLVAGLVAITAPCAFVSSVSAVIIGALAGVLVVASIFFWDRMGVDDPVGVISMHGASGLLGLLAVGLFASGDGGAGYGGYASAVVGILPLGSAHAVTYFSAEGWRQLAAQGIGVCACVVVGGGLSYVLFRISHAIVPMRVTREVELQGLDVPEMGAMGYADFELKTLMSVSAVGTSMPRSYEG